MMNKYSSHQSRGAAGNNNEPNQTVGIAQSSGFGSPPPSSFPISAASSAADPPRSLRSNEPNADELRSELLLISDPSNNETESERQNRPHDQRALSQVTPRSQLDRGRLPHPIPESHQSDPSTMAQLQGLLQKNQFTPHQRKQLAKCNAGVERLHVAQSGHPDEDPGGDSVGGRGIAEERRAMSSPNPGIASPGGSSSDVAGACQGLRTTGLQTERVHHAGHRGDAKICELAKPATEDRNVIFISTTGLGRSPALAAFICNDHLEKQKAGGKIAYICHKHEVVDQVHRGLRDASLPRGCRLNKRGPKQSLSGFIGSSDILLLTPVILQKELEKRNVAVTDFSMMIFEQCHRAVKNHGFNKIMEEYEKEKRQNSAKMLPQIVGFTAAPRIFVKSGGPKNAIFEMCANLSAHQIVHHDTNTEDRSVEETVDPAIIRIIEELQGLSPEKLKAEIRGF